jgi:zinc and cadmium transporter
MSTLAWILVGGVAMTAIALVGSVTLLLRPATIERIMTPLVAFAAGSLLGGAFFHMLPAAAKGADLSRTFMWAMVGFTAFFALEQFLHWHHCERADSACRKPLTYLILIGDALHNFLGGVGVAGVFLIDVRLGITAWLAAAAHEVPQELGDFAVLIHGGWPRRRALALNCLSGSTFLVGSLLAYAASRAIDVDFLVPFAAGTFLYIGASDLVPEVNKHRSAASSVTHFVAFTAGLAVLWLMRNVLE